MSQLLLHKPKLTQFRLISIPKALLLQSTARVFFYNITTPGAGTSIANLCSDISVDYKGQLTNGTGFDSSYNRGPLVATLGRLIPAWQKGIPLIKEGGKISLYIPPTLGYGNQANGPIPANSILIFDISLLGVSNNN